MEKLDILLIVAVIDVGKLGDFSLEELSELWSSLSVCLGDEYLLATFEPKQQEEIRAALKKVEDELRRRHCQPVNLFQLMQENPAQAEYYLKQFSLPKLLDLSDDLEEYKNSKLVTDLLKLVNKQIYRMIPVA